MTLRTISLILGGTQGFRSTSRYSLRCPIQINTNMLFITMDHFTMVHLAIRSYRGNTSSLSGGDLWAGQTHQNELLSISLIVKVNR